MFYINYLRYGSNFQLLYGDRMNVICGLSQVYDTKMLNLFELSRIFTITDTILYLH